MSFKQFLFQFLFAAVIFGFSEASWATDQCSGNFKSNLDWKSVAIDRAAPLSPQLAQEIGAVHSMASAILVLKRFEYLYSDDYTMVGRGRRVLTADEMTLLSERNQSAFDLSKVTSEEATQFVANGARQIYLWLSDRLRSAIIASSTGHRNLKPESEEILEHFFNRALNLSWSDRNTTPQEMEQSFHDKKWTLVAWLDLVAHLEDHAPIFESLTREVTRARESLRVKNDPICCVTEPGCRTCPLNRRHRK